MECNLFVIFMPCELSKIPTRNKDAVHNLDYGHHLSERVTMTLVNGVKSLYNELSLI